MPTDHWYLVHAKPRQEAVAEQRLAEQGYATYCPRVRVPRRRRGRWADLVEPLFPRYLFVGLLPGEQALAPVRSTPGVCTIVRFGVEYSEVPCGLVEDLRAREEQGLHRLQRPGGLTRGDPVRVEEGIFSGLVGVFEKVRGGDRVLVLLEILGQHSRIELPGGYVVPLRTSL